MKPANREIVCDIAVFWGLATVAIVARLVSNAYGVWNFTPVAAVSLFAGFYYQRRSVSLLMPIIVMSGSNLVIGSYESPQMMGVVYAAMLLPVFLAAFVRHSFTALRVSACAVSSSVSFFLLTNFGQWTFHRDHTAAELVSCYVDALPFFRATLTGDLFWSGVVFGSYALATWTGYAPRRYAEVRIERRGLDR